MSVSYLASSKRMQTAHSYIICSSAKNEGNMSNNVCMYDVCMYVLTEAEGPLQKSRESYSMYYELD